MTDDAGPLADEAVALACRRVTRDLVAERGWDLLDEEALVEGVLAASVELSPQAIRRLAEHQYSIDVYIACQDDDPELRERGYLALHRILYRAALSRWPELAEDATQRALVLVYEQIDRCRGPGTFIAFALFKLRHALKQERRARRWDLAQEEELPFDERAAVATMAAHLDRRERCRALLSAIQRLPDARACGAIALKYLAGMSDKQIAARLGVKTAHVRVLRHRGLRRLRQDPDLRTLLE